VDYFLMGREGWSLSEQEFIQVLTSRWPSASIMPVDIPGGRRSVDFRIRMSESLLAGHFNLEGSTVVFYGAPRDCAEFALGYQVLFPRGQPFLLFDEGYNRSIELRPETTTENILRALHDAPCI
jgi:hypothetical protein